jgi:hypothetical protein
MTARYCASSSSFLISPVPALPEKRPGAIMLSGSCRRLQVRFGR